MVCATHASLHLCGPHVRDGRECARPCWLVLLYARRLLHSRLLLCAPPALSDESRKTGASGPSSVDSKG